MCMPWCIIMFILKKLFKHTIKLVSGIMVKLDHRPVLSTPKYPVHTFFIYYHSLLVTQIQGTCVCATVPADSHSLEIGGGSRESPNSARTSFTLIKDCSDSSGHAPPADAFARWPPTMTPAFIAKI